MSIHFAEYHPKNLPNRPCRTAPKHPAAPDCSRNTRTESFPGTCPRADPRSARGRVRRFRQSRNGGAALRENVQLTMNNVQWAVMRLFDDARMGCGAWGGLICSGIYLSCENRWRMGYFMSLRRSSGKIHKPIE